MDDIIDLLQIKIEKAKKELSSETLNAIAMVDWKAAILGLRTTKGYTFEQLGDLELETELLLCGLLSAEDYPKELEKRMGISRSAANELVREMNDLVFKKIREELIKNTERKKIYEKREEFNKGDAKVLSSAGINIISDKLELPAPEKLPTKVGIPTEVGTVQSILTQKLSSSVQTGVVKTDHSLPKISNSVDPYREVPE